MGKSFFLGTDAELYAGSAAFSAQITATPTSFGLVAAQATAYAALNAAYATAYLAATNPLTRTKGAIEGKDAAKASLKIMASDLAKIIDGTATVTDQQKANLGLSVRATPTPRPAPGMPTDFRVELFQNGSIGLKWKCANPAGAPGPVYQVWRRTGTTGEFICLGGAGERRFLDGTVPAGAASVTYRIQAARSTAVGPWADFTVSFGVTSGGTMTASVESVPALKAA